MGNRPSIMKMGFSLRLWFGSLLIGMLITLLGMLVIDYRGALFVPMISILSASIFSIPVIPIFYIIQYWTSSAETGNPNPKKFLLFMPIVWGIAAVIVYQLNMLLPIAPYALATLGILSFKILNNES